MPFNTVKRSKNLITVLILFILFENYITVDGNEYWPSDEKINYSGDHGFIHFSPEPGKISMEEDEITGIINLTKTNDDYDIRILVLAYGTIQNNQTFFSNPAGLDIILNSSINVYTKEIELKIPENGNFTVYMVIEFYWFNETAIIYNQTYQIAGYYEIVDTGFDLANILLPGGLLIIGAGMLVLLVSIIRRSRAKSLDVTVIEEKLEEIKQLFRSYFTKGGEFREIEFKNGGSIKKPGEVSLAMRQRKSLQKMLDKLQPRLEEMDEIRSKHEDAQKPVVNNPLFKIISSLFIRASRKREFYPEISSVNTQVQEIRNSLQQGKWDQLKDVTKIKIAWEICEKYATALPTDKDLIEYPILDIDLEAIKLSGQIRNYEEVKRENPWPSDRNLVLRSRDELMTDLDLMDQLLKKYRETNKRDLSLYRKECSSIKKEAESNLEYLKWLKKQEDLIDINLINRLEDRTQKLKELITEEINHINKLNFVE